MSKITRPIMMILFFGIVLPFTVALTALSIPFLAIFVWLQWRRIGIIEGPELLETPVTHINTTGN
jgi:hypothetical protein